MVVGTNKSCLRSMKTKYLSFNFRCSDVVADTRMREDGLIGSGTCNVDTVLDDRVDQDGSNVVDVGNVVGVGNNVGAGTKVGVSPKVGPDGDAVKLGVGSKICLEIDLDLSVDVGDDLGAEVGLGSEEVVRSEVNVVRTVGTNDDDVTNWTSGTDEPVHSSTTTLNYKLSISNIKLKV